MKKAIIVFVTLLSAILLSACTNKVETTNINSECFASGKVLKQIPSISANIVSENESGRIQDNAESNPTYTKSELSNLSFGFYTSGREDDYNITYELCNSNNKTLDSVELDDSYVYQKKDEYNYLNYESGSYTGFEYTDANGEKKLSIEEDGIYSINVFAKIVGEDSWEYVDQLSFIVVE